MRYLSLITVGLLLFAGCKSDPAFIDQLPEAPLEIDLSIYTDKQSYAPGDTIHIAYHSPLGINCLLHLYNPITREAVDTALIVNPVEQKASTHSFFSGCEWQFTEKIVIPQETTTGIYLVELKEAENNTAHPIVISDRLAPSKLLVLASTNTWQAYNFWGGGSLYKLDSAYHEQFGKVSNLVSFDRPNPYAVNGSHLVPGELHLLSWLNAKGFSYDLMTDRVFHELNTDELSTYSTLILNCHNEYWTDQMVENLEAFIEAGGNVMSLGGNQVYARVTYKDNQMEFHQYGGSHHHDNSEGGLWRNLDRSESKLLGVQFHPDSYNTHAPYEIKAADHPVFEGIDLPEDLAFGHSSLNKKAACGHEMDTRTEHSPASTVLLAKGKNRDQQGNQLESAGEMVYGEYPSGGQFFAVGSITFTGSLPVDRVSDQLLHNVFKLFGHTPVADLAKTQTQ